MPVFLVLSAHKLWQCVVLDACPKLFEIVWPAVTYIPISSSSRAAERLS